MTVFVAWQEYASSQNGTVANVLGVFAALRPAWKACARDYREWRKLRPDLVRYSSRQFDADWDVDYHVEPFTVCLRPRRRDEWRSCACPTCREQRSEAARTVGPGNAESRWVTESEAFIVGSAPTADTLADQAATLMEAALALRDQDWRGLPDDGERFLRTRPVARLAFRLAQRALGDGDVIP